MKIRKFGQITVMQKNGEPEVSIHGFEVEGTMQELRDFALKYAEDAVHNAINNAAFPIKA